MDEIKNPSPETNSRRRSRYATVAAVGLAGLLTGLVVGLTSNTGTETDARTMEAVTELEQLRATIRQLEAERDGALAELQRVDDLNERTKQRIQRLSRYPGPRAESSYQLDLPDGISTQLTLIVVDIPASADPLVWVLLTASGGEPGTELAIQHGTCQGPQQVPLGSLSNVSIPPEGQLTHVQPNLALPMDDSGLWIRVSTQEVPEGPGVRSFFRSDELVKSAPTFVADADPCQAT